MKENISIFDVYKDCINKCEWERQIEVIASNSGNIQSQIEIMCHAALLSENCTNAKNFLMDVAKVAEGKLKQEHSALLTDTLNRLDVVCGRGGWLPIKTEETEQEISNTFPKGVFPEYIETYIDNVAESYQADRAIATTTVLSAFALSLQGKIKVMYPRNETHTEHLCLYTLIVGSAGCGKSPVMKKLAIEPITSWITSQKQKYKSELSEYKAKKRLLENQIKSIEKKCNGRDLDERVKSDMIALQKELDALEKPCSPEILLADTTVEAIAKRMAETGESVGIFSDEGCFTETLAGRYSKGDTSSLDLILKMINGEYHLVDRATGESIALIHPLGSICLGLQPNLFSNFINNETFLNRGVVQRFLFLKAKDTPKKAVEKALAPCREYEDTLHKFLNMPFTETLPVISWSLSASELALEYIQTLLDAEHGGYLQNTNGYVSKIKSLFPRLAAILHMLWTSNEKEQISKETAYRAIQVCTFYVTEKCKEMNSEEKREKTLIDKVIEKLFSLTIEQNIAYTTVSKLQQKLKKINGLKTAKELETILEILQSENKIEIITQAKNKRLLYISPYFKINIEENRD